MFDRSAAQMIITKLDMRHVTVKEAKEFLFKNYRIKATSRTREQLVREVGRLANQATSA